MRCNTGVPYCTLRGLQSAKTWLTSIGEENASVTAQTCAFCHTEAEASPEMAADIARDGYAIYKMEGCPK